MNSGQGASLVQAGGSLVAALMSDTSQAYNAAYGRSYSRSVSVRNAWEKQHAGELSITAAKLKSVKMRTRIGMQQDVAEANVRVNAAAAGVKGGSVEDSIDQTKINAALRTGERAEQEEGEISQALYSVYSGSQANKIPTDNYDMSLAGSVMAGLGSLDSNFLTDLGLQMEQSDWFSDNDVPTPVTQDSGFAELYEGGVTL